MKLQQRIASFLLCLVIMITGLVGHIPGYATETLTNGNLSMANSQIESETLADSTIVDSNIAVGGTAQVGSEKIQLPDIVKEDINASQFTGRSPAKETNLNTFVFKNQDGTQTMKVYSHPVKYIDEKGKVQDISTDIKLNANGTFETKANSIKTTFSKVLKDGITLKHDMVNIRLVSDKLSNAKLSEDNKIVSYVYDDKTTLEYSLTYTGFKEDIVVNEYTGQTEYEFTLHTNGLTLVKENGSYFLKDSKNNIKATIGDIIIFTADERNNTFGDMTHETITANQEYVITIHVDSAYLKDSKTKYPIRIDPTIEINYDEDGAGAIEDVTLNQNTTYSGTSGSLYVGRSTDGSLNRVLMRFPNLSLTGITASQITAANVEIRDIMCQSDEDMVIECRPYLSTALSWSESQTVTWNSVGSSFYGSIIDSHEVSYGQGNATGSGSSHRYRFDITSLACNWAAGTQSPAKGIVFKATNTFENQTGDNIQYWKKTFASYNRSSNKPSLSMSYIPGISINASESSVVEGNSITLTATTNSNSPISWTSSHQGIAIVGSNGVVSGINAGSAVITASVTENGVTISDTCTVYVTIEDGVYTIENDMADYALYTNTLSDYFPLTIDAIDETSEYNLLKTMWKVEYLSHGMYSIRPMSILSMGLGYDEEEYGVLIDIGSADTYEAVGEYARWSIVADGGLYKVLLDGNYNLTLQLDRAFTSCGTSIVLDVDDEMTPSGWNFIEVAEPPEGVVIYHTTYESASINDFRRVDENMVKSLSDLHILPVVYSPNTNSQDIVWTSDNSSLVPVNSLSGTITTYNLSGCAKITGTVTIGSSVYTVVIRIEVSNLNQGRYFIENSEYKTFLQPSVISGNASETSITQYAWSGTSAQEWDITHLGAGYYKICSAVTGLALTLPTGAAITGNVTLIQKQYQGSDYQKWRITEISNHQYVIKCKASEIASTDFVMASDSMQNNSAEGVNIQQREYTNDSVRSDEWNVALFTYGLLTPGQSGYEEEATGLLNSININIKDCHTIGETAIGMSKEELFDILPRCNVFISMSHGSQSQEMQIKHNPDTYIEIDDIDSLENGSLCNVKLLVLMHCYLGADYANGDNIANAFAAKGVNVVISFPDKIRYFCELWIANLTDSIAQGNTIEDAILQADASLHRFDEDPNKEYSTDIRYIIGDINSIPCS